MRTNKLKWIVCLLFSFYVTGCATVSSLEKHFENNFSDFKVSKEDVISKETPFKKRYLNSYDEVWSGILKILSQYAIIVDLSKDSGIIAYIDIDGVFFEDVFIEDKFIYWEFPFTVLIERESRSTMVYIYPMTNLFDQKSLKKKWWKIVEKGFNQKGYEFLEKLSTQLGARERWLWLNNKATE